VRTVFIVGVTDRAASGGERRGGVEERREVVGAHVAALEVGDRGGVGDAVAEEAGSALGSWRIAD
jgi:hypothetical protein